MWVKVSLIKLNLAFLESVVKNVLGRIEKTNASYKEARISFIKFNQIKSK